MMPSVQMCGFLYSGADLCGFSSDTTPDLALRWLEFGLLTPLMRNHSAVGTRMQEYYRFPEVLPAVRNMIRLPVQRIYEGRAGKHQLLPAVGLRLPG